MRQSAYLVANPITIYSNGFLFNCMRVGNASESVKELSFVGLCLIIVFGRDHLGSRFSFVLTICE